MYLRFNYIANSTLAGRKDFSTKVSEAIKPQAQKPATEKIGESITNAADRVAGAVQPESEKGVFQKASDDTRAVKDNSQVQGESFLETAKKEGTVLINTAKNAVNHAAEYIAGQTKPAATTHTTGTTHTGTTHTATTHTVPVTSTPATHTTTTIPK